MTFQPSPYKILALAPFTTASDIVWQRPPMAVDRLSLDEAMSAMEIRLFLPLDAALSPSGGVWFDFDRLKSLHPDGIVQTHEFFRHLPRATAPKAFGQHRELPGASRPDGRPQEGTTLDRIFDMVDLPGANGPPPHDADPAATVDQAVLQRLFDLPAFRRMEAAWRGLRLLLQQGIVNHAVKVEIAPLHAETLEASLEALAPHLIQDPPGLIVMDLAFDSSPLALEQLGLVARWAANLMVPVAAGCAPQFFKIDDWAGLDALPFLPHHVQGPAYAKCQSVASSDAGRWLCLTCNRFLIRYPYGKDNPPRRIAFNEARPLWISSTWALATLVAKCADRTGWPTRFTFEHPYCIQDLALNDPGDIPPLVVETHLTRDRLDQLIRAGITPLTTRPGTDRAFMPKAVTLAGEGLAYQLLVSRITAFALHILDCMPQGAAPEDIEARLQAAFESLSQGSRPPAFERVAVSTGRTDARGNIPVRLALTPDAAMLSSRQTVEMELRW